MLFERRYIYKMRHDIAITNKNFSDINPLNCGSHNCEPLHSFGPHIREYWLLHYVSEGRGTLIRGEQAYAVEKNQIFVIPPHEVTTYTADENEPWSYAWIGFDGRLSERFGELAPVVNIKTNLFAEMLMCEEYGSCREEYLVSRLLALYVQLFEAADFSNDYAGQACDYINANYMHDIHILDIADIVGVERTYLSKKFKEKMGQSMQSYLVNVRLEKAYRLLRSGYNVSQSSYMCGYKDCFNFSKMFKKRYGVSPQKLREKNK